MDTAKLGDATELFDFEQNNERIQLRDITALLGILLVINKYQSIMRLRNHPITKLNETSTDFKRNVKNTAVMPKSTNKMTRSDKKSNLESCHWNKADEKQIRREQRGKQWLVN